MYPLLFTCFGIYSIQAGKGCTYTKTFPSKPIAGEDTISLPSSVANSQRTVPGLVLGFAITGTVGDLGLALGFKTGLGLIFETAEQLIEGTIESAIETVRIDMEFFMILRCLLGGWGSMRALGVLAVHRPWALGRACAAGRNGIQSAVMGTHVQVACVVY